MAAVFVRVEETDHTGDAGLVGPAARIAGERDRAGGGAVIRAKAGHDLLPPADHPGDPDCVFIGFAAAECEEETIEITGGEIGQHLADRSEEHTSELQSPDHLVCRLLLEKKKKQHNYNALDADNGRVH